MQSARSAASVADHLRVLELAEETQAAIGRGDSERARSLMHEQWKEMLGDWIAVRMEGGDPARQWKHGRYVHSDLATFRISAEFAERNRLREALVRDPVVAQLKQEWRDVVEQYKARNAEPLARRYPGMTPEEEAAMVVQLRPVPIPREKLGEWHDKLRDLNQAMKQIDPSFNVFNHPDTKRMALGLTTIVGGGPRGYVTEGGAGVSMDYGAWAGSPGGLLGIPAVAVGWTADKAYAALDGFTEGVGKAGVWAADMLVRTGLRALDGITGGNARAHYVEPYSYTLDEEGRPVYMGAKVGNAEVFGSLWAAITGREVQTTIAELNAGAQYSAEQRGTIDQLSQSVAYFTGAVGGFAGARVPNAIAAGRAAELSAASAAAKAGAAGRKATKLESGAASAAAKAGAAKRSAARGGENTTDIAARLSALAKEQAAGSRAAAGAADVAKAEAKRLAQLSREMNRPGVIAAYRAKQAANLILSGGGTMQAGRTLALGGLGRLAASMGGKGGLASARANRIASAVAGTAGSGVALGMREGFINGQPDGFGKAFMHGFAMAPVMVALGALGSKAEHVLSRWQKMPKSLRRVVAGAVEGFGFGAVETAGMPLFTDEAAGSLWAFLKDPSKETFGHFWNTMLVNTLGMALFKGATGGGPAQAPHERFWKRDDMLVEMNRARAAGDEARATEVEQRFQKHLGEDVPRETLEELGYVAAQMRDAQGRDPQRFQQLQQRYLELSGKVEQARFADVGPRGPARVEEGEPPFRQTEEPGRQAMVDYQRWEELGRIRREGPTPENRRRMIEMLEEARGELSENARRFFERLGDEARLETEAKRQVAEAAEVWRKMTADPEAGRTAERQGMAAPEGETPALRVERWRALHAEAERLDAELAAHGKETLRKAMEGESTDAWVAEGVELFRRAFELKRRMAELEDRMVPPGHPDRMEEETSERQGMAAPEGDSLREIVETVRRNEGKDAAIAVEALNRAGIRTELTSRRDSEGEVSITVSLERELPPDVRTRLTEHVESFEYLPGQQRPEVWRGETVGGRTVEAEVHGRRPLVSFEAADALKIARLLREGAEGRQGMAAPKAKRKPSRQPAWTRHDLHVRGARRSRFFRDRAEYDTFIRKAMQEGDYIDVTTGPDIGRWQVEGAGTSFELRNLRTNEVRHDPVGLIEVSSPRAETKEGLFATEPIHKHYVAAIEHHAAEHIWVKRALRGTSSWDVGRPGGLALEQPFRMEGEGKRLAPVKPGSEPKDLSESFIRYSDIEREVEFGGPLHVPIRYGFVTPKEAVAWFSGREDLIRLPGASELVTLAHEYGHAIQHHVLKKERGLNFKPSDPKVAEQLHELGVALYGSNVPGIGHYRAEGFAEFVARDWMRDPTLKQVAPELYEWFYSDFLPRDPAFQEHYLKVKRMAQRFIDQGSYARTRAAIHVLGDPEVPGVLRRWWRNAKRLVIDDTLPLDQEWKHTLELAGIKDRRLLTQLDPVRMMHALRMSATGRAHHMILNEVIDFSGNKVGESLREILQSIRTGEEREQLYVYLKSLRTIELHKRGIRGSISIHDALNNVQLLENPKFQDVARRLRSFNSQILDYVSEAGALTPAERKAMELLNPVYLPFERWFSPEKYPEGRMPGTQAGTGGGGGRRVAMGGTGLKKIGSSTREINDPIYAMVNHVETLVSLAHRARVMKVLADIVRVPGGGMGNTLLKGIGRFVTEVKMPPKARSFTLRDIKAQLRKAGFTMHVDEPGLEDVDVLGKHPQGSAERYISEAALDTVLTLFTARTVYRGAEAIVPIPHHGEIRWVQLSKSAYEVLMGVNTDPIPGWVRTIFLPFTTAVRVGATGWRTSFALLNYIRDSMAMGAYTQQRRWWDWVPGGNFIANFGGLLKQVQGHEHARLFRVLGGEVATYFGRAISARDMDVEKLFADRSLRERLFEGLNITNPAKAIRRIGHAANRLARLAENFNTFVESAARVQEFGRVLEARRSDLRQLLGTEDLPKDAEADARLRALEAAKEITVDFSRAGAMSRALNLTVPYFNAYIQSLRKTTETLSGGRGRSAQMIALSNAAVAIGATSLLNWWLYKDEEWYQELPLWQRQLFWNFRLPGTQVILSVPKPFELGQLFGSLPEAVAEAWYRHDPERAGEALMFSVGHLLTPPMMPAIVRPWLEVTANYDYFRGRPIVPVHEAENRLPKDQFGAWTTQWAKWMGEALNISPRKIEHVLGASTGGMGLELLRQHDWLSGSPSVSMETRDIPVFGRLFSRPPLSQSRSVDEFYDLRLKLQQRAGSKDLSPSEVAFRRRVESTARQLAELRAAEREGRMERNAAWQRSAELARDTMQRWEAIR